MFATKDEAKQKVAELVAKYESLTSKKLNEEATKQGFILPLFKALGWNVEDSANEVVPEEKASKGRVDYAFKLHGVSQFYLEAKSIQQDINDPDFLKQAADYAYYKGVTWAVLTNFVELRVLNAQEHKPFIDMAYNQYVSDFEDLWLLSREAIEQGLLIKKIATKYGALTPPPPIENLLYRDLRAWRADLSSQLRGYNKGISRALADEIILKFLNRLIFIRTCEDRGIENKKVLEAVRQWEKAGNQGDLIDVVRAIFQEYEGWYDSDLFSRHTIDTDKIIIENNSVDNILKGMAKYPFDLIDADVLGAVYEQYLGSVAVENKEAAGQQLSMSILDSATYKVVDKKRYRKEQGIYYTPKFVTDYIVKETVGHFLAELSVQEVRNIKILDPACGSGSFLIRAFDELLKYYSAQKVSKSESDIDAADRISILTSNIFGVDLDMQAVEITRLNLLLRSLAKRYKLEPLANNVMLGNSLITGMPEELKHYFGNSYKNRQPLSWENEFKDIMAHGGFDVVIGNPPYVRIQSLPRDEADYYRDCYKSASGSFDIYVLFIEKAINLLKPGGRLGFITSGKFLKADYGKKLRQMIRDSCVVESMIDLSAQQIFGEATTYPTIIILKKGIKDSPLNYRLVPVEVDLSTKPLGILAAIEADQSAITKGMWPPLAKDDTLITKLTTRTTTLGELADRIFQGLITSADKVYILEKRGEAADGKIRAYSRIMDKTIEMETALLKPLVSGKHIERYESPSPKELLLFPYRVKDGVAELIPPIEFKSLYPKCWRYLVANRETLENRENGKMKHDNWYAFGRTQNLAMHEQSKFAIPRLVHKLKAIFDQDGCFYLDNVDVGGLTLKHPSQNLYILGLLNSNLLNYYFGRISVAFRGGFRSANRQFLEPLPIRTIDFSNPVEKKLHDDLVILVKRMLELNKQLAPIRNDYSNETDELKEEIEKTDKEIDNLVYDLYGLTETERKTVEDSF